ncbi:MAG: tripartite tricarboxylate transporter substrate binding protein [Rhizobiales bacterium]|nr:tripartite tricarboxylate transporter substrate binding protein [Hyphomicrobiales bacterium]
MTTIGRRTFLAGSAAAAFVGTSTALTEDYTTRPITLVVGYSAGGGNDILARIAAEKMSPLLGQQIVIENRGGAGGSIATRQIARAAPDGYTLGLGGTGTLAIDPTLYPNVGYDSRKDFAPIGLIGTSALVLVVHPSIPAHNVKELIAYAKANPGKLTYASAGVGSGIHLAAAYFGFQAGLNLIHVPYKGTGPALADLVGGHVSMYFSSMPPAISLVKDGKVRALGVTGLKRSPIFPELPTIAEAALPGFEAVLHYGIVAPAGTPKPIVTKLNAALRQAVMSDDLKKKLAADGTEPLPSTPEEYAADIDKEETKWSDIVRKSGAKVQ